MKIFYQIWTNGICNTVPVEVDPLDHISTIKRAIQDREGICLDRQQLLTLYCDGKHLENSKTLADYNISENATLLSSIRCDDGTHRIYVKVSWTGKTIPLEVQPLDTIDEIRQKAEKQEGGSWGGPYPHFFVVFGGKQLESHHTLIYYNIQKEATLHLLLSKGSGPGPAKMIYVTTPSEQTLMLNVEPLYTIRNVKCMIQNMLATGKGQGMGYLPAQQRLIFAGGQLEDERTLQSYNIQNRFTLDLAIRTRPLQVNGQQPTQQQPPQLQVNGQQPPQSQSQSQQPTQSQQQQHQQSQQLQHQQLQSQYPQQPQHKQQYPPAPPAAEMSTASGPYSAPPPSDQAPRYRTKGTMVVPPNSLYVKNLPYGAPEQVIGELFRRFGVVRRVEGPSPSDRTRNFAFIEMDSAAAVASALAASAAESIVLAGRLLRVEERTAPGPTPKGGGGGGSSSRQGMMGVGLGQGQGSNKQQQRPYPSSGAMSMDRQRHTDVGQSLQLLGLGHRMGEVDTELKAKDREIERLHYEMMRMTQQQQQKQPEQSKGGGMGHGELLSASDPHGMPSSGSDRPVDSTSSSSSSSSSSLSSKSKLRMATEFLFREASHQDPHTLADLMNELGLNCGDIDTTEAMLTCCMEDEHDTDKTTLKRLAACLKPAPQSLFRKAFF